MKTLRHTLALCTLAVVIVLVSPKSADSQGKIPPRQPIFLNNNASLYTFQNPNFGMPSQLPYAFVAVAHEDCRLFNNGAKLMPQHRLMAAECQMNGGGTTPIPPNTGCVCADGLPCRWVRYLGGFVPWCLVPPVVAPVPGVPGVNNGINYGRAGPALAYGYGGNYATYNPGVPCCGGSSLTTTSPTASPGDYKGFGSYTQSNPLAFQPSVGTDALTNFGNGFERPEVIKPSEVEETPTSEKK